MPLYSCALSFVRKVLLKSHGDEKIENARGQVAVTSEDVKLIPDVIGNPDRILLGSDYRGKRTIIFQKDENGLMRVVTFSGSRTNALNVQTFYKKKSLSSLTDANAPATTSKTSADTALSDSSVSQPDKTERKLPIFVVP